MYYRAYDPHKDKDAVRRIWLETGWLEKGEEEVVDTIVGASKAIVADISGEAESLALRAPGTMRYLDQDLSMCAVTGITTSRVGRKQGFARRLTAQAVANGAAEGAHVASLGMFEQGFYNQIGFGTLAYEHIVTFDPAELNVRQKARPPHRLTLDDAEIIHAARLSRRRGHGGCNLPPASFTKTDMMWRTDNGFGLGYFDGPQGRLSHFFWGGGKSMERGPYNIIIMVFQTGDQFLELMAVIKSLGDQVLAVSMVEPSGIQLQDLFATPFRQRRVTENSPYSLGVKAAAWSQTRICDLPGCLERTHLRGHTVSFNLKLSDPIASLLDDQTPWRGVGGDYVVSLGASSGAEKGTNHSLPTLAATVNAFTRLWLGVRPASSLAITDELTGSSDLLEQLDWTLRLPEPRLDWEF